MGIQFLNGVPYGTTRQIRELTQAEYDALPSSKYTDGILYCITDDGMVEGNKFAPVIYSTEEREVGTWIDGKPLYEKTFTGLSVNTSFDTWVNTGISIPNGDKVISARLGQTGISLIDIVLAKIESGTLRIWFTNSRSYTYNTFIVQYTKTTDTPGSGKWSTYGVPNHHYSTNEQVIGTWIDGKPIYEITFDFYDDIDWNISYNVWNGTGKYIQNCGRILKATCSSNSGVYTEVMAYSDSDHIKVQTPRNGDTTQCRYLTIQYTKTTD